MPSWRCRPASCGDYLAEGKGIPAQLSVSLRAAARALILRTMDGLNISRLSEGPQCSIDSLELRRCVEAAKPRLHESSAASRLLLVMPESIDGASVGAALADENGPPPTVVRTGGGDLIACHEVERLHVREIAAQLVDNRRDYIEIARRLHTRIDVDWNDMSAPTRAVT